MGGIGSTIILESKRFRQGFVTGRRRMVFEGVHHFNGNNVELGTACGRFFRVGCMSITDPGAQLPLISGGATAGWVE